MNRISLPRRARLGFAGAITVALSGAFAPALAQTAEEAAVTLNQAIELALEHSPQMAQATGALRTARAGERTALGSFLPSLSISSGSSLSSAERFNPQTNTTVSGSSDSYSAGISAGVDLFTGGRRGAQRVQARAETQAAQAGLVEERYAVVFGAKQAYFDVLRADELIRLAESRVKRAQEGLDAAQRRLDVGSATRSDLLRAQLELTTARQSLLQAQNQRRTATYALGRLVGAEGPVGAIPTESLEPRPIQISDQELMAIVTSDAPLIRSAEATLRSSAASERAARTQYLPSLRLSSGYDWFNQDPILADGRTSWNMRLSLQYPLFNGFQREATVERARVQADVAEAQLEDARRAARANAERVLGSLRLAEQQIALAETAVEVAAEDLRVQEERYRLGSSTILELITSQSNLLQAESDLIAARFDYQLALAELESLVGREL